MIITPTPEQMAALPEFRERWLRVGLSTEPANRPLAEQSIGSIYELCGFSRPKIFIWTSSPFGCQVALNVLHDLHPGSEASLTLGQFFDQFSSRFSRFRGQLLEQLRAQLGIDGSQIREQFFWSQVWQYLNEQLDGQVREQLWTQLWRQCKKQRRDQDQFWGSIISEVGEQLHPELWHQVHGQLSLSLEGKILDQHDDQIWTQIGNRLKYYITTMYSHGSLEAYSIAFLRYCQSIGVKFTDAQSEGLSYMENVTKSCFWWYPFKDFCIVSDRPSEIHIENGLLHNETGPAILFRDGYALWSIDGMMVSQKIVMHPETLTVAEIDKEINAEVRRIMIQRFGPKRYMEESGAECIDVSAGLGLTGSGPRALYETKDGDKWLVGSDGSTKRIYWMPVPREAKTCAEAHCLIAGIDTEARCIAEA
jgi:hypothetical protein